MTEEVMDRLSALESEIQKIRQQSSTCSCDLAKAAYHLFHAAISKCWNIGCNCGKKES